MNEIRVGSLEKLCDFLKVLTEVRRLATDDFDLLLERMHQEEYSAQMAVEAADSRVEKLQELLLLDQEEPSVLLQSQLREAQIESRRCSDFKIELYEAGSTLRLAIENARSRQLDVFAKGRRSLEDSIAALKAFRSEQTLSTTRTIGLDQTRGSVQPQSHGISVRERYLKSEMLAYQDKYPFDSKAIIRTGAIKKVRHSISELPDLLNTYQEMCMDQKGGEILFVQKLDGSFVFSMRFGDYKLPHPVLVFGANVRSAGTLRPSSHSDKLLVSNRSGHYRPYKIFALSHSISSLRKEGFNAWLDSSKNI